MLTPNGYKQRLIEKQLDKYLEIFGAICIEGPKYCGKTWTALSRSKSVANIGDPTNNFQTRSQAQINPAFVLEGNHPRLVDEWQEVPSLWDAVRYYCDKNIQKGLYVLTGSATPKHKGILHSGTGRIARIKMNTMSLFETGDSSAEVSLIQIFQDNLEPIATGEVDLNDLIYYVVRGGWPESINMPNDLATHLPKEYLNSVVNEDLIKVDGVKRNGRKVRALLHSLARNESTTASNATLIKDMANISGEQIDTKTIADYINALDLVFLLDNVPSFNPSLRSSRRTLKADKRHFVDTSLAVAAMGATPEMLFNDLQTFGFLFEGLCLHDLKIYAEYNGGKFFHYRDSQNKEADAIIALEDGRWAAFEIKLGAHQIENAAKNLLALKKTFTKESSNPPCALCVICGMSNMAHKREDGVYVLPITALRP